MPEAGPGTTLDAIKFYLLAALPTIAAGIWPAIRWFRDVQDRRLNAERSGNADERKQLSADYADTLRRKNEELRQRDEEVDRLNRIIRDLERDRDRGWYLARQWCKAANNTSDMMSKVVSEINNDLRAKGLTTITPAIPTLPGLEELK